MLRGKRADDGRTLLVIMPGYRSGVKRNFALPAPPEKGPPRAAESARKRPRLKTPVFPVLGKMDARAGRAAY